MSKNKKEVTIDKLPEVEEECHHYWIIKSAAGPVSYGVCKYCHAKKEFGNYIRDCLEIDKDSYRDWAESPWRDQGEKKKLGKFLTELKGGEKDEVTTVV